MMIKTTLVFLFGLTITYSYSQSTLNKVKKLGIVSELVYIKYSSENYATRILNDSTIPENFKKQFVNIYQQTKTTSDQILIQLISDIKRKNSIRFFKKLDRLFLKKEYSEITIQDFRNKKMKSYIAALQSLYTTHNNLLDFQTSQMTSKELIDSLSLKGFFPSSASLEEITGVLSFVTSTVKEIRETKEKKVEKISTILESLRLEVLKSLIKQEKTKDKK